MVCRAITPLVPRLVRLILILGRMRPKIKRVSRGNLRSALKKSVCKNVCENDRHERVPELKYYI